MTIRRNSVAGIRLRIAERAGRPCATRGCSGTGYHLGQACAKCQLRKKRHGTTTQQTIRKYHVAPYAECVARFLSGNRQHPAIVTACALLADKLSVAAARPVTYRPKHRDWGARLRLDLQRLHRGNVTGEEMFSVAAALYLLAKDRPGLLTYLSRGHWFAVARLTLSLRARERTHLAPRFLGTKLPGACLEDLGRSITRLLHPVLVAMSETIERQATEDHVNKTALEAALASIPFTTQKAPTSCPQTLPKAA